MNLPILLRLAGFAALAFTSYFLVVDLFTLGPFFVVLWKWKYIFYFLGGCVLIWIGTRLRHGQELAQPWASWIGEFSWKPPPWWVSLESEGLARISSARETVGQWVLENKRFLFIVSLCGAVVVALGIGGYFWYRSRPRPAELSVTLYPPGPTRMEKGAKPDPLRIHFSNSAAKLEDVGKGIDLGVRITPAIPGKWTWISDREMEYKPSEDWAVGQEYSVRFEASLFPEHVRPEHYEYKFRSAPFQVSLQKTEFYQDPRNPKEKKVVATVVFSHPVDPVEFEQRVVLRKEGQRTGFLGIGAEAFPHTVTYNEYKTEAYIHSSQIAIPLKSTFIAVTVDAGVRSARGGPPYGEKLEQRVQIPGMYDFFRVQSVELSLVKNERYETEQVLVVTMTAGASESEIQRGLIAYALPRDLPSIHGQPAVQNYRWGDVQKIGPEILQASERLKLEPLPTDREYAAVHSFRFKAEPGGALYIKLEKGIQSFGEYVLAEPFDQISWVPQFQKELEIMYDGAILSLSGEKKISVVSRAIEALQFEVARVLPGEINHLVSQSGGNFRSPYFRNYYFGPDNITERFTQIRLLPGADIRKPQFAALDLSGYLVEGSGTRRGLFFVKARSWDPVKKVPTGMETQRMILVTNLGLLVKEEQDGGRKVFVQSIHSGDPAVGAQVDVIGKNGLVLLSRSTNEGGMALFPPLDSFEREKTPTAFLARYADDLSFIPYDWPDRRLDFSRFDTGGVQTSKDPGHLMAYLFSDRGIYRPGDEIRVGLIVKPQDWKRDLTGVPLEIVVTDPRGVVIHERKIRLSGFGFEEIRYTTEENGPTGGYQFAVYIVKDDKRAALLSSTMVRVEEFLPDRMKIATRFSKERPEGWVLPKDLKAMVSLRTLFGTPAAARRISASLTFSPRAPFFRSHQDYTFRDPNQEKKTFSERLEDTETNEEGEAEFDLDLERFHKAFYRLSFLAEGYEGGGGRAVTSESSVFASDLPFLLGYKPDGDLKYIRRDSRRSVRIIAVDPVLKQISAEALTRELVEQRYVSVLTRQRDGTYKYESVQKDILLSSAAFSVPAAGLDYDLPTGTPGDYVLLFRDAEGAEILKVPFSVIGEANLTRSLERNAELQVKLSRSDYAPGESVEMRITAPYMGAGLLTIEKERVYAYKWFRTRTTSSIQRITIPEDLEGNGYVNVAFVRAADSPQIYMSPLSYGVQPFTVSVERRTNRIDLEIPKEAQPGEPYRIRFRNSRKGRIVVFAVDEGILQVAGYKTPDPLARFFEKRALEVQTAQIVDLILPEYALIRSLSAPGGGEYEALGKNLNPFKRKRDKPIAYWSGIQDAGPEWQEVAFDMPDYFNGTVRVMVVSVSPDAIGVAEQKGLVRGPFVLSPNVPLFAAPGDEFEVTVGVHNGVENSGPLAKVETQLETSTHLEVVGPRLVSLTVPEGRERVARFQVKAGSRLGSGNLTFKVSGAGRQAKASVELSVRPTVPYMTTVVSGHMRKAREEVVVPRKMFPHFRILEASVSTVPLGLARGLATYLDKFPYTCTEQLVSRAVPAMFLRKRPEFGYAPEKVEADLSQALRVLMARQNSEGAFGFWAANSHVSPFQTTYALHFLTEAREGGYSVPESIIVRGLRYLDMQAAKQPSSLAEAREVSYALYVLTRNGRVTTHSANALRQWLEAKGPDDWEKDLVAVYLAAVYKMLHMDREALGLIRDFRMGESQAEDYGNFYDGLLRDAQYLYILARHFQERLRNVTGDDILKIVDPIAKGQFNTTTSAFTILALDAYVGAIGPPQPQAAKLAEVREDGGIGPLVLPGGMFPKVNFSERAAKVRVQNLGRDLLFHQTTQAGFDLAPPREPIKNRIEVFREYAGVEGGSTSKVRLGSQIEVRFKLRALEGVQHANVAVVDLFPAGFEVVLVPAEGAEGNARIAAAGSTWRADYADVREDRVVLFGTVGPEVQEFVYRIRSTNKGRFQTPPLFAESMYDRSVKARGMAGSIEVTDAE